MNNTKEGICDFLEGTIKGIKDDSIQVVHMQIGSSFIDYTTHLGTLELNWIVPEVVDPRDVLNEAVQNAEEEEDNYDYA